MDQQRINDYAESMFVFERLHPRWVDACASYLRHVFGNAVKGKVFLDYAFGRGNWSLAALKAGAAGVIAIDAAEGAVRRFSDYCTGHGIDRIKILHANVLHENISDRADILWVYGILSNIPESDALLSAIARMRRDDDAIALLYSYDSGSWRQIIVEAARQGVVYSSESAFAEDSLLFSPRARLRARDDLVAPVTVWYTAADLAALAMRNGYRVRRQISGFGDWTTKTVSHEFSPHHLVCGFAGDSERTVEPVRPHSCDLEVLRTLASAVVSHAALEQRKKLAVGLYNGHFSGAAFNNLSDAPLMEDFLFLMHAVLRLKIPSSAIPAAAAPYYAATIAAISDEPRRFTPHQLAVSSLARFLNANTVRF